jgi:hypothetical protein
VLVLACVDIPTSSSSILSFEFDPLPSPSVVVGDSLRDSLGVAKPITFKAFNYSGEQVTNPPVQFTALDRGIHVDALKGYVIGDSARSQARISARLDDISSTVTLVVTLRPDTIIGSNARDSLAYSLSDTLNVSPAVGVKLIHGKPAGDSAVASYVVSFRIASQPASQPAQLVNDANRASQSDTTDASGVASRKIRLDVTKITNPVDSVIIEARAQFKGALVAGAPVRLVVKFKPK